MDQAFQYYQTNNEDQAAFRVTKYSGADMVLDINTNVQSFHSRNSSDQQVMSMIPGQQPPR